MPKGREFNARPDSIEVIRTDYDKVAKEYAIHLFDELDRKPLDRELLSRFAELNDRGGESATWVAVPDTLPGISRKRV